MKINIKFLKPKKNYQKEKIKIKPDKYWQTIVSLFFIIVILISIFSINLFREINTKETDFLAEQNKIIEKEKKEEINKVLEYFSKREQKSEDIINSSVYIIDPSL